QGEQKKLAKFARDNGRLWAGNVHHYLGADALSADSAVMAYIGIDAYLAAGGKTTSDLLGELPDTCTDLDIAYRLWAEKAEPLKAIAEAEGFTVFLTTDADAEPTEAFCSPPYRYNRSKEEQAELARLKDAHDTMSAEQEEALATGEPAAWEAVFRAKLAHAKAFTAPMPVRAVLIQPCAKDAVRISTFTSEPDVEAWYAEKESASSAFAPEASRDPDPLPERKVVVDTSDRGHAFHRAATDALVRGFRRCLADSFVSALKMQVAAQFQQIVLIQAYGIGDDKALQISCAKNVQSRGYMAQESLDKELVERLIAYREHYVASGLRPYAWVSTLGFPQIQDLLALMTAANIWLEEDRTDRIKSRARGQIQEVADELDFDLRAYWYPDGAFYARASKKQLLRYASLMGCDLEELVTMKKAALADFVAEQGVARQWLPPALSFANDLVQVDDEDEDKADDAPEDTETASHDFEPNEDDVDIEAAPEAAAAE
ncbi:MAG TPA: hypothetical protein VN113_01580, partial [Caulobacter sp.]|nr:hypothetical protein [Caulobacter sp.]